MFFWSKYLLFSILAIFAVSCGGNIDINKKKDLPYYLVELGDRKYSLGEYSDALKYYDQSVKHNKNFQKNIYIVSRIVKTAIKLGNNKGYLKLIKTFEFRTLKSSFEKEVYHYTLGKYFLFHKDDKQAKVEFSKAKKLSGKKRDTFYDCLIANRANCKSEPILQ